MENIACWEQDVEYGVCLAAVIYTLCAIWIDTVFFPLVVAVPCLVCSEFQTPRGFGGHSVAFCLDLLSFGFGYWEGRVRSCHRSDYHKLHIIQSKDFDILLMTSYSQTNMDGCQAVNEKGKG